MMLVSFFFLFCFFIEQVSSDNIMLHLTYWMIAVWINRCDQSPVTNVFFLSFDIVLFLDNEVLARSKGRERRSSLQYESKRCV